MSEPPDDDPYQAAFRDEYGDFALMAPVLMTIGRLQDAGIPIRAIILPRDLFKGKTGSSAYGHPVVRADVDKPGVLV